MKRFILRRLLASVPTLLGVCLITFVLFHWVGGDPVAQLAGRFADVDEISLLRHEYGLDRPLAMQFFKFLGEIVTLDFGRSFQTRQRVLGMFADGALVSLVLALPAFLLSQFVAVSLGLLAVAFRRRWPDRLILAGSVVTMSVSALPFILLGQYFLAYRWNLFPISGFEWRLPGLISHLMLPWLLWTLASAGADIRFYRTVFLEELGKEYIRTARSKGADESKVFLVHLFRGSMLPVITRTVVALPFLLLGSLLLENFFGIPGLGNLTVEAFNNADWPVVKAITVLGALAFVAFQLLSDLLGARVDPRVVLK